MLEGIKPTRVNGVEVVVIDGGDYENTWNRGHMNSDDCPTLQGLEGDAYFNAWENAKEFWERYIKALPGDEIIYNWTDG